MSRRLTRPLLSSIFFVGPVSTLKNPSAAAERAKPVTGPILDTLRRAGVPASVDAETLVRINAGVQVTAAAALATGRFPRLSASVLAASLVPTTLAGHAFWRETDPAARRMQQLQFAKNLSILGGLALAALDTDGKPGKAWLARAAARELGRRAEHLATTTKLEAKIAQLEAAGAGDVLVETLSSAASGLAARGHAVVEQVSEVAEHVGEQVGAQVSQAGEVAGQVGRTVSERLHA